MKISAKQKFAQALKQRVLSLDIAPGQLLDETSLSLEFGISRTPLREIIQRLCGEGYLTLEENRGAKVASMDFTTLRHFFQAAPMIYASVARLAAEQSTAAHIDILRNIQNHYREAIERKDAAGAAMQNHRFHEMIGSMASSPYLSPSLNRLLIDHTRIGQMFYQSTSNEDAKRIAEAADQHDAMIEALADNNPAAAVELTLKHWDLSRGRMEKFVSPDPLPHDLGDKAHAV